MNPGLTCSFLVWLQLMAYFLSNWGNNESPPRKKQEMKKSEERKLSLACLCQTVKCEVYYTEAEGEKPLIWQRT